MKGLFRKISICLVAFVAIIGLASCNQTPVEEEPTPEQVAAAKTAAAANLENAYSAIDLKKYDQDTVDVINQIYAYGQLFVERSTTIDVVNANLSLITGYLSEYVNSKSKLAEGVYSYVASSYSDRTEILGILEKYAVEAGITGITVFEDSGYVLYDPNAKKGTENYIVGYGFGALTEGSIVGDLEGETNPAWKRYFHTYETDDPKNINYGDDKGEVVGDLVGYVSGSYWGTRMNETKDGYEWYSDLANEKPVAQNASEVTGLATQYKFELKVGSQLKYNTNSTIFAKYKGQEVKAEDYLTPYKLLWTKANGWARAAENLETASAIKGSAAYYGASADGYNETSFNNVGLKVTEENGKAYMTVEFMQPCSSFYAMYYLASTIYAPIPQEFVDEIGGPSAFGKFVAEKNYTPVDTTLSTGPFVLEAWEDGKQIVFKNNELIDEVGRYNIAGVHVNILTAAKTDNEAALKEFLASKLHSCGIPSTKLDEYKNDPRASKTVGATTTKLNVNTCDAAEWEYLFGANGLITQTDPESYWEVEPALSCEEFVSGLSYSINRAEFAESVGRTASVNYFGAAYMGDPENGIAYNSTEAHKTAIADLIEGTDGYGYSLEKARAYFKQACEELLAKGAYQEGDTIKLEIAWQSQSNVKIYHGPIKQYWESAFNHESVCGGKLTLEVVDFVPATWSDVYYKKMMVGQYDIGFGGINGNTLNPLNFFEVLKSDNSSGFTLNWGPDTSKVSQELVWDDQAWSFDALWQATETGGYFKDGNFVKNHDAKQKGEAVLNADGTATFEFKGNMLNMKDESGKTLVSVEVADTRIFAYFGGSYDEDSCEFSYDAETDIITVTVSAELYNKYIACDEGNPLGIDVYFNCVVLEIDSSTYNSLQVTLPVAAK